MQGDEQALDDDGNLRFREVSPKLDDNGDPIKRWKDARILDRAIDW